MRRSRIMHRATFEERLAEEARRLKAQAKKMAADREREELSRMKRLRYQRRTLRIGLMIALAISIVVGMVGYYGVLVWRFFFD
jgi:hypothetical protein